MRFGVLKECLIYLFSIIIIFSFENLFADEPEIRLGPLVRHTHDGLDKRRPSWSPDGKTLAFARHEPDGQHVWQYVWDLDGADAPRRLTTRDTPHFGATFSPDGTQLLFVAVRFIGLQGNLDIARIDVDGSNLTTVVTEGPQEVVHQDWPSWSPDGRRLAFSSTHEGNQEIYVADIDGSNIVRLTQHPGHDAHPCWSPDGQSILFATDRWDSNLELASVRPDGTGLKRLTHSPGLDDYPAVSPDGRWIAFVSNRDGQFEIYVASAEGSRPVNISRHPMRDTHPTWTPDGQGVTFVSNREDGFDIYTRTLHLPESPPDPQVTSD